MTTDSAASVTTARYVWLVWESYAIHQAEVVSVHASEEGALRAADERQASGSRDVTVEQVELDD